MKINKILIPLPSKDFDPTEVAVTWELLSKYNITFATPDGNVAVTDMVMIHGEGLGLFSSFLIADKHGQSAYEKLIESDEFKKPISYEEIEPSQFDAIFLPGGHAPGMKDYLESILLQDIIVDFFSQNRPVGAICHGVLLVARSISKSTGKSVLYGRSTTALLKKSENLAWHLTKKRMGNYYKTYPETTVEEEVREYLKSDSDFIPGPFILFRDSLTKIKRGFFVRDKNYLSARWPGDVHAFSLEFKKMLEEI